MLNAQLPHILMGPCQQAAACTVLSYTAWVYRRCCQVGGVSKGRHTPIIHCTFAHNKMFFFYNDFHGDKPLTELFLGRGLHFEPLMDNHPPGRLKEVMQMYKVMLNDYKQLNNAITIKPYKRNQSFLTQPRRPWLLDGDLLVTMYYTHERASIIIIIHFQCTGIACSNFQFEEEWKPSRGIIWASNKNDNVSLFFTQNTL